MINNEFDIFKQLKAKKTAIRYIKSCNNTKHVDFMEKYIELYKNKFEDYIGYYQLKSLLDEQNKIILKYE